MWHSSVVSAALDADIELDVRIERGPAIALFEKFGFQLTRTREHNGRRMLDFYLDLYREPSA